MRGQCCFIFSWCETSNRAIDRNTIVGTSFNFCFLYFCFILQGRRCLPFNMEVIEIKEKEIRDKIAAGKNSFLQFWQWGEFQKSAGFGVLRLALPDIPDRSRGRRAAREGKNFIEAVQIIKYPLLFGKNYYYLPCFKLANYDRTGYFLEYLKKDRQAVFVRLEPDFEDGLEWKRIIKNFGLKPSPKNIQPQETTVLNTAKSPEEILAAMKPKTRYNIRLAEKKGVGVRVGGPGDFEIFWRLMKETIRRDKFSPHPKNYYEKLINSRGDGFSNILFIASAEGEDIAAVIVNFSGDKATYLHGVSSDKHRELMAPYLLQWRAILEAGKRGCLSYDFHGVSEKKWPGVTRFKLGFGGEVVKYVGSWDYVLRPVWYAAYKIARKISNS